MNIRLRYDLLAQHGVILRQGFCYREVDRQPLDSLGIYFLSFQSLPIVARTRKLDNIIQFIIAHRLSLSGVKPSSMKNSGVRIAAAALILCGWVSVAKAQTPARRVHLAKGIPARVVVDYGPQKDEPPIAALVWARYDPAP